MEFVKVASKTEIESGKGKSFDVGGKRIAVLNQSGEFFAIDDKCCHADGPLGEGYCENGSVICPWHGWEYDLKSGKCNTNPDVSLNVYAVKVEGEDILIDVNTKEDK